MGVSGQFAVCMVLSSHLQNSLLIVHSVTIEPAFVNEFANAVRISYTLNGDRCA